MSRTLILAVALGVGACASADADVRVFVTSSAAGCGLDLLGPQGDGTGTDPLHEDWPIDPFRPTYSQVYANGLNVYPYDYYYAYYRVAAFPPIDAPSGTADNPIVIDVTAGQWAYIWFQFREEPKNAKVGGLIVEATPPGQRSRPGRDGLAPDLEFTYYLQNNLGALYDSKKRWTGAATPPAYPEWHNNPQTMLEGSTWGIANTYDDPTMMFDNQGSGPSGRTGVALLGAVTGSSSDTVYAFRITDVSYANPPNPHVGESTFFRTVPEPAALWLLTVGAARQPRRR